MVYFLRWVSAALRRLWLRLRYGPVVVVSNDYEPLGFASDAVELVQVEGSGVPGICFREAMEVNIVLRDEDENVLDQFLASLPIEAGQTFLTGTPFEVNDETYVLHGWYIARLSTGQVRQVELVLTNPR
jgi:hypothetical protein